MNIAIDYDGTWTADPFLFNALVGLARHRGHECFIVTGRKESDRPSVIAGEIISGLRVICCNGRMKEEVCRELGIKIDIWIDDMPGMIQDCMILRTEIADGDL